MSTTAFQFVDTRFQNRRNKQFYIQGAKKWYDCKIPSIGIMRHWISSTLNTFSPYRTIMIFVTRVIGFYVFPIKRWNWTFHPHFAFIFLLQNLIIISAFHPTSDAKVHYVNIYLTALEHFFLISLICLKKILDMQVVKVSFK